MGTNIGIIAAQSIGEPGTQLTMRTFHTGGIFTENTNNQITASYSGRILLPKNIDFTFLKLHKGNIIREADREFILPFINFKKEITNLNLKLNNYLYTYQNHFFKKGQLISETPIRLLNNEIKTFKPMYNLFSGEVFFNNLFVKTINLNKYNLKPSLLCIKSSLIYSIFRDAKIYFSQNLKKNKSFAYFKIISPFNSLIFILNNCIYFYNKNKILIKFNLKKLKYNKANYILSFNLLIKNYDYIEENNIIGYLYLLPKINTSIYSIKQKYSNFFKTFSIVTDNDIFKIYNDKTNPLLDQKNLYIKNLKSKKIGYLMKNVGFTSTFQKAVRIFLDPTIVLHCNHDDLIVKNTLFISLINNHAQNKDIVQDLPKIEMIFELQKPLIKSVLSPMVGVFLKMNFYSTLNKNVSNYSIYSSFVRSNNSKNNNLYTISQTIKINDSNLLLNNNVFDVSLIVIKNSNKKNLNSIINYLVKANNKVIKFKEFSPEYVLKIIRLLAKTNLMNPIVLNLNNNKNKLKIFKINSNDLLIKNRTTFIFLKYKNIIKNYTSKIKFKASDIYNKFIYLGNEIKEDLFNIYDLLNIFYFDYLKNNSNLIAYKKSINKIRLILLNSIQSIYQNQNISISNQHFEILIKQMTSKSQVLNNGDTPLFKNEIIKFTLLEQIYLIFQCLDLKLPFFKPVILSMKSSSTSNNNGFISNAGFQETKKILIKAAIHGTSDWLMGLRECITIGRLQPSGSTFLNYKNYLDNIYLFKDIFYENFKL